MIDPTGLTYGLKLQTYSHLFGCGSAALGLLSDVAAFGSGVHCGLQIDIAG
jgi:hypothetical protein